MKLIDFILCDDVRNEVTGKNTIVGVYGDIVIPIKKEDLKGPVNIRLAFYIRLLKTKDEVKPDSFFFEVFFNGKNYKKIEGPLQIPDEVKFINLNFNADPFSIPGEGVFTFKLTFNKDSKIIQVIEPDYNFQVFTQK